MRCRARGGDRLRCGPGTGGRAGAALRSFVINTLSTAGPGQVMFVAPKADVVDLLELDVGGSAPPISRQPPLLPSGLMVTASADAALDVLEGEALMWALVRPRHDRLRWAPTLVFMATTMFRHDRTRLETVLDLGSGYGVAAILAGYRAIRNPTPAVLSAVGWWGWLSQLRVPVVVAAWSRTPRSLRHRGAGGTRARA